MHTFPSFTRPRPALLLLCLLWWSVVAVPGEAPVDEALLVSQDHAWPPFAFRDEQGQPRGLLVEFWLEIGQRMGRPVEFRLADWPDSIRQVREGQAQVHGGLVPSPERSAFLDFSTELMPLETYVFVASASRAIGVDDLTGTPIGVTEASFEAEFMTREHPGMTLRPFRNNEQMILAAVRGEIAAFVADYPVGLYLLDRHARPTDFRVLQGLYRQPLVAAVPKGDTELLRAIDAALATFDAEDRRRLLQRWVRSEKVEVLPGWVIPSGLALLFLSLSLYSLMLWRQRRQLAREVAQRTADLRASESQFRMLFESAAVSVMIHDRHSCEVIDANHRALAAYGVSDKASLHEMNIWMDPPYSFADVQRWFARVREEGPQRFEWVSRSATGKVFWEDVSLHQITLRGIPRIVSTSVDITDRKALEDKLRANEAKFRAIVENANDIIYSLSPTGIFTYVSPNWTEKLGHEVREVVGRPFDPFVHPDDLAVCYEFLGKVLESRMKQGGVEYRVRHVNGEWHWHVSNASPVVDEQGEVTQVIGIARDITERKDLEARMMHMAHYDPLTDLPNRVLFYDRAEQALRLSRRVAGRMALLLLDLDKFKPVNDEHGHAVGDLLLQEAARRMMDCLRTSDTVGRIGGDEFVILLPAIQDARDATEVADKLRAELARPFHLASRELRVSCSIGIALFPEHGTSMVELTKCADLAMYASKEAGRDRWSLFHEDILDTAGRGGPA